MAFASGFRRILGGSLVQSHFNPVRFNSTISTTKLFVSDLLMTRRIKCLVTPILDQNFQKAREVEDLDGGNPIGLSRLTTDEKLKEAFSPFGQLLEAKVITDRVSGRSKGFGFVRYATVEDANNAREGMNAKFLDGWVIFVDPAKPKEPKPQPPPEPEASETGFRTNKTIGWCG